ncbi:hypothetical protein Pr1d_47100 [Bythopirellula goksoeyrii]|uniref:Uncharacterized protein n=1 Tax=Bythopirellula goksoeyrii TaxID=1400387 RepID=A0A5B9QEC4_9BACT|nr:hypothetical protein Pr1d_47100 [Bythopirellula goksoeyrii]
MKGFKVVSLHLFPLSQALLGAMYQTACILRSLKFNAVASTSPFEQLSEMREVFLTRASLKISYVHQDAPSAASKRDLLNCTGVPDFQQKRFSRIRVGRNDRCEFDKLTSPNSGTEAYLGPII